MLLLLYHCLLLWCLLLLRLGAAVALPVPHCKGTLGGALSWPLHLLLLRDRSKLRLKGMLRLRLGRIADRSTRWCERRSGCRDVRVDVRRLHHLPLLCGHVRPSLHLQVRLMVRMLLWRLLLLRLYLQGRLVMMRRRSPLRK